jgi:hypothetical protein
LQAKPIARVYVMKLLLRGTTARNRSFYSV